MKRLISLVLILSLALTSTVFASGETMKVLADNNFIRSVKVTSEAGDEVTSIYHKIDNTIEVIVNNNEPVIVDLNKERITDENGNELYKKVREKQNTYMNFEYTRFVDNEWELRRPDPDSEVLKRLFFKVNQTEENYDMLRKFAEKVNAIDAEEKVFIGASSLSVLLMCIASFMAGWTGGLGGVVMKSILASLGVDKVVFDCGVRIGNLCDDALTLYWDVYDTK